MAKSGDKKRIQENQSFLAKFRLGMLVSIVREAIKTGWLAYIHI